MKKCIIKREQISDIEELIQELKSSQPSGLCLRGCCLGDAGIERLVDNLPKTLESLDLVDNNITANGAKKIAVWLETSELNELLAQALEITILIILTVGIKSIILIMNTLIMVTRSIK